MFAKKRVLTESKNYRVRSEYEVAFLLRKPLVFSVPLPEICIGDFYGDPSAAVIDEAERFVVVVGYGLVIYHLVEPFTPYRYGVKSSQWIELFRESSNERWINDIVQTSQNTFIFRVDAYSSEAGNYQLTWPTLDVMKW